MCYLPSLIMRNDRILDMGSLNPFYEYHDNVYFATAYQNAVYKLTKKGLYPVYCWDFGKDGINDEMLQKYRLIENEGKRNDELIKDLSDGTLPFCMKFHRENDLYYYVSLQKGLGTVNKHINVFYRKQDGSTFVFEKLVENLSITPLLFTEDYIISKLNFDDYTCLRPFLSEQDYSKLLSREEDDNPCLVKFYFRKGGKTPGRM